MCRKCSLTYPVEIGSVSVRACFGLFGLFRVRIGLRTIFVTWLDAFKHVGGFVREISRAGNLRLILQMGVFLAILALSSAGLGSVSAVSLYWSFGSPHRIEDPGEPMMMTQFLSPVSLADRSMHLSSAPSDITGGGFGWSPWLVQYVPSFPSGTHLLSNCCPHMLKKSPRVKVGQDPPGEVSQVVDWTYTVPLLSRVLSGA